MIAKSWYKLKIKIYIFHPSKVYYYQFILNKLYHLKIKYYHVGLKIEYIGDRRAAYYQGSMGKANISQ